MRISWDERKNRANRLKHGVSFKLAMEVFEDPLALSRLDSFVSNEQRWQTLGMVDGVLLLVCHTFHDESRVEVIRIISARKATTHERKQYEQG